MCQVELSVPKITAVSSSRFIIRLSNTSFSIPSTLIPCLILFPVLLSLALSFHYSFNLYSIFSSSLLNFFFLFTFFFINFLLSFFLSLQPTQLDVVSLGVKRPRREADHSPPSNAEVKNAWSYISTPQYVFLAWCLIKQWICLHGCTSTPPICPQGVLLS